MNAVAAKETVMSFIDLPRAVGSVPQPAGACRAQRPAEPSDVLFEAPFVDDLSAALSHRHEPVRICEHLAHRPRHIAEVVAAEYRPIVARAHKVAAGADLVRD